MRIRCSNASFLWCCSLGLSEKPKRGGQVLWKRGRGGRRGGRVETGFSIRCFASLPLSPDPHYALFSHNEGAEYKRGSVRQKLVWVAMHSIMVGSESKVGAQLWRKLCSNGWSCIRNPNDVTMYKVDARTIPSGALPSCEVSYTCKLRKICAQSVASYSA